MLFWPEHFLSLISLISSLTISLSLFHSLVLLLVSKIRNLQVAVFLFFSEHSCSQILNYHTTTKAKTNSYTVQSLNDYCIPSLLSSNFQPPAHSPLTLFQLILFISPRGLLHALTLTIFYFTGCFFQHLLMFSTFFRFLNISFSCSDLEIIFLCSLTILTSIFESRPFLGTLLFHLSHCIPSQMHQRQLKQQAPKWIWFNHWNLLPLYFL